MPDILWLYGRRVIGSDCAGVDGDKMKTLEELRKTQQELIDQMGEIFGTPELGGTMYDFLYDVMDFAEWANGIVEDAKRVGSYDAIMHKRCQEDLDAAHKQMERLHALGVVGIGADYMREVCAVGSSESDRFFAKYQDMQAMNQLADSVRKFIDTIERTK